MTYIVNTGTEQLYICRGCKELETAIRRIYFNGDWLHSIVPVNYTKYVYFAYEFDQQSNVTGPINTRYLYKWLRYFNNEGAIIRGIYPWTDRHRSASYVLSDL